jgi:thiamine pyrophosphokinase
VTEGAAGAAARHALVLADGSAPTREALDAAWPGWDAGIDLVIAADGGARLAETLDLALDSWVGDGDSLGDDGVEELRRRGISVALEPTDKDTSDTELALLAAIAAGAGSVVILGALGGARPDHAVANLALLGHPAAAGRRVTILDPSARVRLLSGPAASIDLPGRIGDLVSLIPLETTTGVRTTGLRFALDGEILAFGPARGISNVRMASPATVSIRTGRLLVMEVPATLAE